MYKISVPVMSKNLLRSNGELLLEELRRLDAKRVFIALDTYPSDEARIEEYMTALKESCAFFKSHGYEVGSWNWTFIFEKPHSFTPVTALAHEHITSAHTACAADGEFVAFVEKYMKKIAQCGVDMIMFDDDFRYAHVCGDNVGCLCPKHVEMINQRVGERLTREELAERILSGGKNKYRDAWLDANREAFESFAGRIRAAVDEVNPNIRIGACACFGSWDIDGTNAVALAKILAGKTKPFVRLIGAPYWADKRNWGNRLADVVELERMESAWTRRLMEEADGIEIMAEGDCYPRPRTTCPAAYLEGFDTAIRASGATDGILKYGIDYYSSPTYERGYAQRHERNRPIYEGIDRLFGNKTSVGVRIYESMKKVGEKELPDGTKDGRALEREFFSIASRALGCNAIPSVFEGSGVCGMAFGENARYLDEKALSGGLIIDGAAAKLLTKRGIDVGIEAEGGAESCGDEYFVDSKEYISLYGAVPIYRHKFSENIKVMSYCLDSGTPVTYFYENKAGQKFFVLNFTVDFDAKPVCYRHYARSKQISDAVKILSGKSLPAYCYGNPDLYLQAKESEEGALAVGLWNFHADDIISPTVELGKEYKEIKFLGCSGTLEGNRVILSDIPPFGFAAFEVK